MGCLQSKSDDIPIHTVKISDMVIRVSNSGSIVETPRRHSIEQRSRFSLNGNFTNNPVIDGIIEYQTYGSIKNCGRSCDLPKVCSRHPSVQDVLHSLR